jgi:hypothetical protein
MEGKRKVRNAYQTGEGIGKAKNDVKGYGRAGSLNGCKKLQSLR